MNDDYGQPYPDQSPASPIDWSTIRGITPWLICGFAWVVWFGFLLVPTFYGLHNTALYPIESNIIFVMTGLVLALASGTALGLGHLLRSALFAAVIFILSFWF